MTRAGASGAMLATLWVAASLAPAGVAAAGSEGNHIAAIAQAGFDHDVDGFGGRMLRGGLLFDYDSYLRHAGIAVQNVNYAQDGWSKDVPGIVGIYRQQRATLEGIRAEAGLVSVDGRPRVVGEANWSLRPRPSTGVELIAAGDVVGTREAIEHGITYGLVAASVEQQFGERVTVIALAGWQPFTDGNSRNLLRARTIVSIFPEQGISAQIRWRQFSSSEADVAGAYFNPDQYRNWDAGLSLRHRVGGWIVAGLAGGGQERIDDQSWKPTGILEVRAEGPLSGDKHLAVSVLYSNAAGFATEPDYWYGSINVSLIMPLRR